jgi:SAM-dependent methyltransferase
MREDFYDRYYEIEGRHWWFRGRAQIIARVIASLEIPAASSAGLRILDVGTGTGAMLPILRRFGEVQGVDANERAVAYCHARGETVLHIEDHRLPFADGSVDLLTALDVLEHIEDDRAALREIRRVLAPEGRFVATVPANPWMWGAQDEVSHHFRRYTAASLRSTIAGAGLAPDRITHFNTLLFPPIAAVRLLRRLKPAGEVRSDFEMPGGEGASNRLLARLFGSEARWLRRADLPFGVSLLTVARDAADATV